MPATVVCHKCDNAIPTVTLHQHLNMLCSARIEEDMKALSCSVCGLKFEKAQDLKDHRSEHQESSMILDFADKAGCLPANLLDLLRQTMLIEDFSDRFEELKMGEVEADSAISVEAGKAKRSKKVKNE